MKKKSNKIAPRAVKLFASTKGQAPSVRSIERAGNMFPVYTGRLIPDDKASLAQLAEHVDARPEDVRKALVALVKTIPDKDLKTALGAQITLVT